MMMIGWRSFGAAQKSDLEKQPRYKTKNKEMLGQFMLIEWNLFFFTFASVFEPGNGVKNKMHK